MTQPCTKIAFPTEEEARTELFRIVDSSDYRIWKGVKPCRLYHCPYCNQYHLTSKLSIFK